MPAANNEKMTAVVIVHCYPSERKKWLESVERRELSRTIRQLMSKLCSKLEPSVSQTVQCGRGPVSGQTNKTKVATFQ
jgi:hypothetical protein